RDDGSRSSDKQMEYGAMHEALRIRIRLRRFVRHHPRLLHAVRAAFFFTAAFSAAYGFVTGARSELAGYNPQAFALGVSFLFALACVGLAMLSIRLRWLGRLMRKLAAHNEMLADRNWELKEAEEWVRTLFESQGDLVVIRNAAREITFANEAY